MIVSICEICGQTTKPHARTVVRKFCSRKCHGEATKRRREAAVVGRDWLYQKYIVEGLPCPEIAKMVGRDAKSVWNWIKGYGIPTRPRGSYEKVYFREGHTINVGTKLTEDRKEKIRQARLKDGRVPYRMKDGTHAMKGRKGSDHPKWNGGATPERQAFYATDEWKSAMRFVWGRDRRRCRKCGISRPEAKKIGIKFAIHHVVTFAVRELRAEPTNLILLCRTCHLWVHSRANADKEFIREVRINADGSRSGLRGKLGDLSR